MVSWGSKYPCGAFVRPGGVPSGRRRYTWVTMAAIAAAKNTTKHGRSIAVSPGRRIGGDHDWRSAIPAMADALGDGLVQRIQFLPGFVVEPNRDVMPSTPPGIERQHHANPGSRGQSGRQHANHHRHVRFTRNDCRAACRCRQSAQCNGCF